MKKLLSCLLAAVITFTLFGCTSQPRPEPTAPTASTAAPTVSAEPSEPPQTEPTEPPIDEGALAGTLPEGAGLYDLDLSGKSYEQATDALNALIADYRLQLTVNSRSFSFSAKELSLELSTERFARWFSQTVEGVQPDSTKVVLFNISKVTAAVKGLFGETARNAAVTYRQDLVRFVIEPHRDGAVVDTGPAENAAIAAIRSLSPSASATATVSDSLAPVKDDDPRVVAAMDEANSYLMLSLSYTFQAENIVSAREAIDIHTLATFVTVQNDYSVTVNEAAVQSYIKKMAERHGGSRTAPFVTTYGTTISYNVEYYRAVLDQAAMCQDLMHCLKNKISGTRSTTYRIANNADKPYGGDYVEVNLSEQCLWVYRNGEMKITTPLVSGNVSTRKWTDPGVFTLYEKDRNATLAGTGYVSYVDYWMAFNGPIGLHDATWRSSFGGDIYKYNGSHGCVNLPYNAAKQIFDLVYVGMKVIVYGGAKNVSSLKQEITGTSAHTVAADAPDFSLNLSFKYEDTETTYVSDNPSVVRVDDRGTVTIVGTGTATITVTSVTFSNKTFTVTVTVTAEPVPTDPTDPPEPTDPTDPSEPTDPTVTEPSETEAPTETESTEPEVTAPQVTEPPTTTAETAE